MEKDNRMMLFFYKGTPNVLAIKTVFVSFVDGAKQLHKDYSTYKEVIRYVMENTYFNALHGNLKYILV